jgi:uncharacterized alkaline shock family protein YloU
MTIDQVDQNIGEVKIVDNVISIIAGIAANEVEGVVGMYSDWTKRIFGNKLEQGIEVKIEGDSVFIETYVVVESEKKIQGIAIDLQEHIKEIVETMTDLRVAEVVVHVCDVAIETKE